MFMSDNEQWVWLIWGLKKQPAPTCDLVAIATTEEIRDKYQSGAERRYTTVHTEKVLLDHAYGHGMLLELFNRAKR